MDGKESGRRILAKGSGSRGRASAVVNGIEKGNTMLGIILLVLLVLLLMGALPNWPYSRNWGYGPSGGLGLIAVIILAVLLIR